MPIRAEIEFSNSQELEEYDFEKPVAVAVANATRLVSEDTDNPSHWGQLGKLMHAHEVFDRATASYLRAFELEPSNTSWLYLSAVAMQTTDPVQAAANLKECIQQGFDEPFVVLRLAELLERTGERDRAEELYLSALDVYPDSPHALIGLARLAMLNDNLDSAAARLERARTITPSHGPIYPLLVQVYRKVGRDDESRVAEMLMHTYTQAIPIADPLLDEVKSLGLSSNALSIRGMDLAARGRLEEAEELFRRVLEMRENQVRDAVNLGVVLARQGRFDEAIEVLTHARSYAPDHVGLLSNLGLALSENGDLAKSKAMLEHALEQDPQHSESLFNMANLHLKVQRFEEAIKLLTQALQANPGMLEARFNLGAAYASTADFKSAIREWELLSRLNPSDSNVLFLLGSAYVRTDQFEKATDCFRRGLETNPKDARFQRALDALTKGNGQESVRDP